MELPCPEQVLCFEGLLFMYNDWVLVSKIFYFHLYLGKRSNLTIVFQMGWIHPSWFVFLKHILAQNTSQYLRFGLPNGSFTGLRTGCPPKGRREGADSKSIQAFNSKGFTVRRCQTSGYLREFRLGFESLAKSQARKVWVMWKNQKGFASWHPNSHPFWHPENACPGGSFLF